MAGTALEMTGLEKRYGKRRALAGLDLRVGRGVLFGLVGSNGAGKTTTLSIAAGITKPNRGSVNVLGEGLFDAARSAGRLSLIPQGAALPPHAVVRDLLMFYARLQGLRGSDALGSVVEVLEWARLSDRAKSSVRSLSHGMQRRIAIAQAFLGDPELVLLDEPMSGLDPREVVRTRNMLVERKGRQTIVVSSHNLSEIERMCDEAAFIEEGRTVRQDSMESITGRRHAITYLLESDAVPLERLGELLPDARFSPDPPGEAVAGCGCVLRCEYDSSRKTAAEVNAVVVGCLLESGAGLVEVRRGCELESAYLEASDRPFPVPS